MKDTTETVGQHNSTETVQQNCMQCRRMAIITNVVSTTELYELGSSDLAKHSCCDFCEKCCNCGNCMQFKLVLEKCVEEDIEDIDFYFESLPDTVLIPDKICGETGRLQFIPPRGLSNWFNS